jgi:hypothetical protein
MECLLDQFCHAAGKFVDAQRVGNLRADLANEVQLIESEAFHSDTMRHNQTHRHHTSESLEQIQFGLFEFRPLFTRDLKRSQHNSLIDHWDCRPGLAWAGAASTLLPRSQLSRFQGAL